MSSSLCSVCKKPIRPLHFLVKYCDRCGKRICHNCWIERKGVCYCPCGNTLSDIPDDEILKSISQMYEGQAYLNDVISIDGIPEELSYKVSIDSDKHLITFYKLLTDQELDILILRSKNIIDAEKLIELNKKIQDNLEERKGRMMSIDSSCIPICHFNK